MNRARIEELVMQQQQKRPDNKPKAARGPRPEVLKIKGNWQFAIKKSLTKKRPAEGRPK
jgi:hypothetical protein